MRENTFIVVIRKATGVTSRCRDCFAALGPGEGVGSVGIQGQTLPLAAAGAEDVELPVCGVGV
jgi:hypothetical protein